MLRFHLRIYDLVLSGYMHNTHTVSHFGFRLLCRFSYPLCLRRFVKFNVFVSCDGSLNCLQNNNRKMEFACTTWSCFGSHNRKKIVLIQSLCLSLSFNQYHSLFVGHCVVFARAHTLRHSIDLHHSARAI